MEVKLMKLLFKFEIALVIIGLAILGYAEIYTKKLLMVPQKNRVWAGIVYYRIRLILGSELAFDTLS
jgi:hypothetical protein